MSDDSNVNMKTFLPVNWDSPNKIVFGLLDPSKVFQSLLVSVPLVLFIWVIPFLPIVKILLFSIPLSVFVFGLVGYQGRGLLDLIFDFIGFSRSKKNFSLFRVNTTHTGRARKMNRRRNQVGGN